MIWLDKNFLPIFCMDIFTLQIMGSKLLAQRSEHTHVGNRLVAAFAVDPLDRKAHQHYDQLGSLDSIFSDLFES